MNIRSEQVQPTKKITILEQSTQMLHSIKNDAYPSLRLLYITYGNIGDNTTTNKMGFTTCL